ncbi:MAG: nuclear transport factor 2 family protein [Planctomycetota bacterium]
MPSITDTARKLFDACESGKGWDACREFCHADATFGAQADALAEVKTVEAYTEWMAGMYHIAPDARYEIHAFAADEQANTVMGFGTFYATHTEEGGPVPPTGKAVEAEYVYIFTLDDGKVRHMTKVWNDGHRLKQIGWA